MIVTQITKGANMQTQTELVLAECFKRVKLLEKKVELLEKNKVRPIRLLSFLFRKSLAKG